MRVRISEIAIEQRKRGLDEATADRLMVSIEAIGLLNPVTVTKKEIGYPRHVSRPRLAARAYLDMRPPDLPGIARGPACKAA